MTPAYCHRRTTRGEFNSVRNASEHPAIAAGALTAGAATSVAVRNVLASAAQLFSASHGGPLPLDEANKLTAPYLFDSALLTCR
jgi:hypothetical protein